MNYAPYHADDHTVSASGAAHAFMDAHSAQEVGDLSTGLASTLMLGRLSWDFAMPSLHMVPTAVSTGLGFAAVGVSAALGAATAKQFLDNDELIQQRRVAEVRRHAPMHAPPEVELTSVSKQLLSSLIWALSAEEGRTALLPKSAAGSSTAAGRQGDVVAAFSEKEVRKHQRRIWQRCRENAAAMAGPAPPSRGSGAKQGMSLMSRRHRSMDVPYSREFRDKEAYMRLFNSGFNVSHSSAETMLASMPASSVQSGTGGAPDASAAAKHAKAFGERKLCAALCYLVTAYLELRLRSPGSLQDAERASLRLAVAALASVEALEDVPITKDPLFADAEDEDEAGTTTAAEIRPDSSSSNRHEFLQSCLLVLCYLDAALSWKPLDPWANLGWFEEGASLLQPTGVSACTYKSFATYLSKSLKKTCKGVNVKSWRRLRVYLDNLQHRELPEPWPFIWAPTKESSLLVRNHTKVYLRVELYRSTAAFGDPLADWPMMLQIYRTCWPADKDKDGLVLSGEVGPGFEWPMRPPAKSGQQFRVKLLTEAGVVVCKKKLRRGQSLDFEVRVPGRCERRAVVSDVDAKATKFETESVDTAQSTAVPSSSARLSVSSTRTAQDGMTGLPPHAEEENARTAANQTGQAPATPVFPFPYAVPASGSAAPPAAMPRLTSRTSNLTTSNSVVAALCPRCLQQMAQRRTKPAAKIYAEGVRCDHCSDQLVNETGELQCADAIFHCGRCWFDLCRSCALREMQDVWWNDDDDPGESPVP